MRRRPLVEVEWEDAHHDDGWAGNRPLRTRGGPCRTAGYMLKRDRRVIVIAHSLGEDPDDHADTLTIPRGCVSRIRRLR